MLRRYNDWPTLASILVLIVLIASQIFWIRNSKRILEEQFENRAIMALCTAVENLSEDCLELQKNQCNNSCIGAEDLANGMSQSFDNAVGNAVKFYGLPSEWEVTFVDDVDQVDKTRELCCPVLPMQESAAGVALTFPERDQLIYARMKMPILSSSLMVLVVMLVFRSALKRLHLAQETYRINQNFYNNIGHELRTPLTNIGLATKLLRRTTSDSQKYLNIIEQEKKRMEEHTEKMLYLAALEDGTYQLNKEKVVIDDILTEVSTEMSIQIAKSGLDLQIECPKELHIEADRYHIKNAISSLIDNCIKYVQDQPSLGISVVEHSDAIVLAFTDNGNGISRKDQQYVFDKYYRVSDAQRGYGLGLPYVKMIMEAHRGAIQLFSEAGRGCKFLLSFPKSEMA